ncbi:Hypothetical protein I596_896 [Dokdonella koreensis DS-123]|uniref:Uncharacterized protein n=1 Tax=Dokdonella koreensis DS-123 TaxID=1300342 RepID=A0A160DRT0_9GAMM|nr:Hypothetical protein I596_896 [Dokdonella koreensis DS-123]
MPGHPERRHVDSRLPRTGGGRRISAFQPRGHRSRRAPGSANTLRRMDAS